MFLRNLARDEAYKAEAPTMWDVDDRTAIAQAEMEDREIPGTYHRLAFHRDGDAGDVFIETTRPELLAACVALVAHPDDERHQPLFGTSVRTPLFEVDVPIVAHRLADPEKGSGIAMICTFGDVTDVIWWRELRLPTRAIVDVDGRIKRDPPAAVTSDAARAAYAEIAGKSVKQAQARMVELLQASGEIVGEPRAITHPVKFYERGKRPLEIVTSRQWYIRNGGRDDDRRAAMLARGRELDWIPVYMRARFESWVEGLNGDWLISRQRFFGVPFPVWYPIGAEGTVDYDRFLTPADDTPLPIDPSTAAPPGYTEAQRGAPGGFVGDSDVMDTWATSSLTPQIACGWTDDADLFARTFPMDLRSQAHEIIRTWLFSTVVRAHYEHDTLPWKHAAISGWVLDPDRKKMSKSRGNVVVPMEWLDKYGADALRYWAASARPGTDATFDEGQIKVGRKFAIKMLNLSKFVLMYAADASDDPDAVTEPLDRALLTSLVQLVEEATSAFDAYDYARALERAESFFWSFCDDYVELVKGRAWGNDNSDASTASARTALRLALSTLLRLLAPFLAFVTEEVWSWWHDGSIHRASWPAAAELAGAAAGGDPAVYVLVAEVLGEVRKVKSEAKVSLAAPAHHVIVHDTAERIALLEAGRGDLCAAGKIGHLRFEVAASFSVEVELAEAG
jgi:valyl-tRNA synthetase